MRQSQNTVGQTLHSVQQFLDTNAAIVGPGLDVVRTTLDVAATTIGAHFVQQDAGARSALGATQKLKALKTGLRFDHMRPIAEIAKRKLATVPEFKALALPPYQLTTTRLVTAAQAMADAAEPYAHTFMELGLAPDFIVRLHAAVDEITNTLAVRKHHTSRRTGATAGIAAAVKEAHSIVKLLDSLVRPRIRANAELNATWMSATRFRRAARNVVPALAAAPVNAGSSSAPTSATPSLPSPAATPAAQSAPAAPAAP